MGKKAKRALHDCVQYGALPYGAAEDGALRVLLVTTRQTRRWVVPKGWPMRDKEPHQAAAQEAFEEAGVVGTTGEHPLGSYQYWKRLKDCFALCTVEVFPLEVEDLREDWPERAERQRRWFPLETAATMVEEPGLRTLIANFRPL